MNYLKILEKSVCAMILLTLTILAHCTYDGMAADPPAISGGSLLVETRPSGAMVYLDGVQRGKSPLRLNGLRPGKVKVVSLLIGYDPAEKEVVVEAGQTRQVTLLMSKPQAEGSESSSEDSEKNEFTNSLDMKFVYIEPGTFMMGSPENTPERNHDERQHQVRISEGFYLQTTEVTQGQWKALMGTNPSQFRDCGDECPVEKVSWNDAQEFISKLNRKEGTNKYRLPTEAEWEYACRAGISTTYSWGNKAECSQMMYANEVGTPQNECVNDVREKGLTPGSTAPVMSYAPNSWGLYDMHGNVWEWCQDLYSKEIYYTDQTDPVYDGNGLNRVFRGGSWRNLSGLCRSAFRNRYDPGRGYSDIGFRIARTF